MSEELLDVVDASDHVVGTISRTRLREAKVNYRVVHVFVFDRRGRLLVQRLAKDKATRFSWGSSVAGHVQAGESYEAAARREFEEELGMRAPALSSLGTTWIDEGGRRKFIGVLTGTCDGPFRPDSREVESLEFQPISTIRDELRRDPDAFSPTFERVFRFVDGENGWPTP